MRHQREYGLALEHKSRRVLAKAWSVVRPKVALRRPCERPLCKEVNHIVGSDKPKGSRLSQFRKSRSRCIVQ
jgi:hypothetical protein